MQRTAHLLRQLPSPRRGVLEHDDGREPVQRSGERAGVLLCAALERPTPAAQHNTGRDSPGRPGPVSRAGGPNRAMGFRAASAAAPLTGGIIAGDARGAKLELVLRCTATS